MTEQMSRHDMSEHKQKDAIKNVEANLTKRGKHFGFIRNKHGHHVILILHRDGQWCIHSFQLARENIKHESVMPCDRV